MEEALEFTGCRGDHGVEINAGTMPDEFRELQWESVKKRGIFLMTDKDRKYALLPFEVVHLALRLADAAVEASRRVPSLVGGLPPDAKMGEAEKAIQQTWELLADRHLAELMDERGRLAEEGWIPEEKILNAAKKAWDVRASEAKKIQSELSNLFASDKGLVFEACLYFASRGFAVVDVVERLKKAAEIIKKEWGNEEPELVLTMFDDPEDGEKSVDIVIRTYVHRREARKKRDLARAATETLLSELNVGLILAPLEA